MVDAVVSFVVQRLGDYLIEKAVFLDKVRNEVEGLKSELEWMHSFLKDAEDKLVDNALIRQWVSDIRAIAYDSEDVLDTFMLQVRVEEIAETSHGPFTSIKKCSCIFIGGVQEKVSLYDVSLKIQALRERLDRVSRKRIEYSLQNINIIKSEGAESHRKLQQVRRTVSFAFEKNVVGFEDDFNTLLEKLLANEPRRFIISIWGTGGLGKTTLASKLYRNDRVKDKFDYSAWVSVSQDYNARDLLQRIIKSFHFNHKPEELEKKSEEDLERYLHKSLLDGSYLVVIDDVWEKEAWESLKRAFPSNEKGSRVIMTTRIEEVAECSGERTHIHKLRFLRPDESWQLFCEKAFEDLNPDETLQMLGREMVKKCGGLPLAIVVLSGLLSNKTLQEWYSVRDHLWRDLRNGSIQISNLLVLSFNDLPYQLKLCFLYVSRFPEDFEIVTSRLIRLWVAEGFIPNDEDIMEDIAHNYLNELTHRSLIQAEKIRFGQIYTCRVHDLLRDLAILKARELSFVDIYDGIKNTTHFSRLSSCRRVAVYSGTSRFLRQQCSPPLRSLFFLLGNELHESGKFLSTVWKRFRFLRVLDISCFYSDSSLRRLAKHLGKLFHLKYLALGFYDSGGIYFPTSIFNLSSLETLHVRGYSPCRLPTKISKLQQLRHLIGYFEAQNFQIGNLTNLQTLKYISGHAWNTANPETLVNLRELRILPPRKAKEFTFDSMAKLQNLRILEVASSTFSSLQPVSLCRYLVELRLSGMLPKLPGDMHTMFPKLERLSLSESCCSHDPMPILEKLPNLNFLELNQDSSHSLKPMICTAEGFPRLEILIVKVERLQELQVEEGCMPMLRGLDIRWPEKLIIPERLKSIPPPPEWEFDYNDFDKYTSFR